MGISEAPLEFEDCVGSFRRLFGAAGPMGGACRSSSKEGNRRRFKSENDVEASFLISPSSLMDVVVSEGNRARIYRLYLYT